MSKQSTLGSYTITTKKNASVKKTSQKKVSIKGKTGYERITKTRKSYRVGPSKQTYWKHR